MSKTGSVTCWIQELKRGDHEAARRLWSRYFQRLLDVARQRFPNLPRRLADEEDVVLNVLDSFFRDAQDGRLPNLDDRASLWRLLLMMTSQKALDLVRAEKAKKRPPAGELAAAAEVPEFGLSPDEEVAWAERWQVLLDRLGDDRLRSIAVCKLENWTNEEIAAKLDCSVRTVEHKLHLIRKLWEQELLHEPTNSA